MQFECSRCKSTDYFFSDNTGRKTCKSCNLLAPAKGYSDSFAEIGTIGAETNKQLVTKQNQQLAKSRRKYIIGAIAIFIFYLIGASSNNSAENSKQCKDRILGEYVSGRMNDIQYQAAFNACGP